MDVTADPLRPMVLHWAVNEWQLPPQDSWPSGTKQVTWAFLSYHMGIAMIGLYGRGGKAIVYTYEK